MRVACLVLVMLLIAPIGQSSGEENEEKWSLENKQIMHTYSISVQHAFARVSDLSSYDDYQLSRANSWLVVTGIPLEKHHQTIPSPEFSEPVRLLRGSFIWTFDDPGKAISRLSDSFEMGEIESFSPMLDRQLSPKSWIPNDPFFDDQWHLYNSGQTNGTSGEDANVSGVWESYNGSGVVISVIDDGVDHSHSDLNPNWLAQYSYDWCGDDPDPSPSSSDAHGTAVAGVAAGVGNNSIDVIGAAHGAGISGHRLIACGFSGSTEADALSFENDNIDIYSNSWGPADTGDVLSGPGPLTIAAIEDSAYNGRSGLGNIYTWAAGNGLEDDDNSNYDGWANNRHTIAVAAISHYGEQSYYSEPGANILVTAHSDGGDPIYEGITTTDITGSGGYSGGDVTHWFGGTSSATPLVSGVIALVLEANPSLTWRDVQNILVHSSRKNDANDSSWNTNGAGLRVSHKYGFGAIDAGAAVSLAENWTSSGIEVNASFGPFTPNTDIENGVSTWTDFHVSVPLDLQLESVDVLVDISHTSRGNLDIVLESPSGHQSWLAEEHTDGGDDYSNWMFGTVQHWDESSNGNWTLKIRDSVSDSNSGTVNSWQVIFHGVGNVSDFDGDGWPDYNDLDDDDDGWNDTDELSCGFDPLDPDSHPTDTDADGSCDFLDEDDDGDGFDDESEVLCDSDPLDPGSYPIDTDSDGSCDFLDEDDDGDGFDDESEVLCDSDPLDPGSYPIDTDSDGSCDFLDEDDDGDGLSDYNETEVHKTDPLDSDSDDDGLTDYQEVVTHGTLPLESDTDGDGLGDYEEVFEFGTNPILEDSDADGLNDSEELFVWSSDPLSFDPDNDSDSYYHFLDCDDEDPEANPGMQELLNDKDDDCDGLEDEGFNDTDLDGDGLSDWAEFHLYGTDLNNADSDGDGLSDAQEVEQFGSDPLFLDIDFDGDGSYWFDDCDDNDTSFSHLLPELLDNLDNDCDDLIDEDFFLIDTDGDGISDYSEFHDYSTNPNNGDSDQDGLPDGIEIKVLMSDPLTYDPDLDQDGWYHFQDCDDSDFERSPERPEALDGKDNDCDEEVDEEFHDLDSDGDGLSDFSEYHNHSTSPFSADTDQDGIDDRTELMSGLSNPVLSDYDRDEDGFYEFEDCDDLVGSTFPGAKEEWNGIDEDCDGEIDEMVDRMILIKSSQNKSRGTVFSSIGEIYDGPNSFTDGPILWDSANHSFSISLSGIRSSLNSEISWTMAGYPLEVNTSKDGKSFTLLPIDCKFPTSDLQIQICDEGFSTQTVRAVIYEEDYYTELEWDVTVSTWEDSDSENGLIASLGGSAGIIAMVFFLIGLVVGGAFLGVRFSYNKRLQDALEAYGVSPESLAIRPENKGVSLPSAPNFPWSSEEEQP